MQLPVSIRPKYLNPGSSNAEEMHCMSLTYFHGQQIIAYGSVHLVVIASTSLNVISALDGHPSDSIVTSVAWAPYSGKLSSASTKLDIIIWEPEDGDWVKKQVINVASKVTCMSWSISDLQFCVASDNFVIYHWETQSRKRKSYEPFFTSDMQLSFCSYSRDSRFILTLTQSNQEVFVWHKRPDEKNQYRRIPLYHPSPVLNMRWRTSDQVHERCSFMTLAQDRVVRIWTETSVNEQLAFNVVAAIPSRFNSISAAFITTSSRLIKNNSTESQRSMKTVIDTYAYGHGHMPPADLDYREAKVASNQELKRNTSWLLTCDSDNVLRVWELSGISVSVRRTPKIRLIQEIPRNPKISPGEAKNMFVVCRLESQLSHLKEDDEDFIGKPQSLSLILQNQKTRMIENVDVTLSKNPDVQVVGRTQGHTSPITSLRIHQTKPFMLSIDKKGVPLIWKYDDTDVYDPTVLTKFGCELSPHLIIGDWNGEKQQLLGFTGSYFILYDIPNDPSPSSIIPSMKLDPNLQLRNNDNTLPLDFRYCTTTSSGSWFILLNTTSIYILLLNNEGTNLRLVREFKNNKFVFGAQAYISTLFPLVGATLYFAATADNEIFTIVLENNTDIDVAIHPVLMMNEPIVSIDYSHPGFLFVITKKHIFVTWRKSSQSLQWEIIQTIDIDYEPINAASIATGLFAVISKDQVHMYHPRRNQTPFPSTYLYWDHTAQCTMKNINAIEWSLDGILVVAQKTKISAFTKFMDSFFLQLDHIKAPTIHHSFAQLAKPPSDFSPMNLYPIAASGRLHLLFDMLKFMNDNYGKSFLLGMYTDRLLKLETQKEDQSPIPDDEIEAVFKPLIQKLEMEQYDKAFPIEQNKQIIHLLNVFKELQSEDIKSLEPRAQVVARCALLDEKAHLPFEIITLGYQVYSQMQLLEALKITTWEQVEKTGIIYWCKSLDDLYKILIPIAVSCFEERRYISIVLLTLGRKFKILQRLFSKAGDDTRAQFFVRDFSKPKERKFAERNAYSALSKHDYHISAAMFFLSGQIESVVRVLLKNLGSYTLSFLACRCLDEGIGQTTRQVLEEAFLPRAREAKDLAAVEFFELIGDPNNPIELAPRMTQAIPGFFYKESAVYGDTRFNVCETANTTLSMKTDYVKSAFFMGNQFLTLLYLPYFASTVLPPELQISKLPIHENFKDSPEFLTSFGVNVMSQSHSQNTISHFPEQNNHLVAPHSESMFIKENNASSNSILTNNSEHINQDEEESKHETLGIVDNTIISEEEEAKEEESAEDPFGYTGNYIMSDNDYSSDDYSSSSDDDDSSDSSEEDVKPKHRDLLEERKNIYLMRQQKCQIGKSFSRDLLESTHVDNWFNEIILFNICRYRLEYFIQTQYHKNFVDSPDLLKVIPEIELAGPQTSSIKHQLQDYLIRSCKRRCFIFRRMLLMSTESEKLHYILEVCRNISLIPDQILSFHISAQQITQLAATARILILYVNSQIIDFHKYGCFPFIVAAICTALFMYSFYYEDSVMMKLLLELDLARLKTFPKELLDGINITNCPPGEIQYDTQKIEPQGSFFSFILNNQQLKIKFQGKTSDEDQHLKTFVVALLDFMLISTFVDNIDKLKMHNSEEFDRMHQFLWKLKDIYLQIFQYAVLIHPISHEIRFLSDITFEEEKLKNLNALYKFLLERNNKMNEIPTLCVNLYNKFSDAAQIKSGKHYPRSELRDSHKIRKIKADVTSMALNHHGTHYFVTTKTGLLSFTTQHVHKEDEDDENNHLVSFSQSSNQDVPVQNNNNGKKTITERIILNNKNKSKQNVGQEKKLSPIAIVAHPKEDFAVIGDESGSVYACLFNGSHSNFTFQAPQTMPCSAVALSYDGGVVGTAHGHTASLYSFFLQENNEKPFAVYDVWGEKITCMEFITGSGLFACGQTPSEKCKACVTFWDSLLPNNSAMIASIKYPKGVYSTSMSFSMNQNMLVTGCSDGNIAIIDTRMFQITSTFKAHSKHVTSLKVDKNQAICFSGGNGGKLKIWNMHDSSLLSTMSFSGMKSNECIGIDVHNDTVYTLFSDGSLYSSKF